MRVPLFVMIILVFIFVLGQQIQEAAQHTKTWVDGGIMKNRTAIINEKENQSTTDSRFGEGSVYILQAANKEYFQKNSPWTENRTQMVETNKKWARRMNYTHDLKLITEAGNFYTAKVQAIYDELLAANENDWIIFLDSDVRFQAHTDDTLEHIIPIQSKMDNQTCEFIAMAQAISINTGVVLLKSTNATKSTVLRWLTLQQNGDKLYSFGAADQLSLQEIVMQDVLGSSYKSGLCSAYRDQAARNHCFGTNLPEAVRSAKHMCWITCNDDNPLQCSGCNQECNRTKAIFWHDTKTERNYARSGFG